MLLSSRLVCQLCRRVPFSFRELLCCVVFGGHSASIAAFLRIAICFMFHDEIHPSLSFSTLHDRVIASLKRFLPFLVLGLPEEIHTDRQERLRKACKRPRKRVRAPGTFLFFLLFIVAICAIATINFNMPYWDFTQKTDT